MTDLEKAARMALEALEYYQHRKIEWDYSDDAAITAIREALAENPAQQEPFKPDWVNYRQGVEDGRAEALEILAKQEPVGQLMEEAYGRGQVLWFHKPNDLSMLYTSPPASKPWVGLTEEEYRQAEAKVWAVVSLDNTEKEANREFYEAIEAKLKEKNA